MSLGFKTFEVPGKIVLTGEHAVVRGHSALAMPHPDFKMKWTIEPSARWSIPLGCEEFFWHSGKSLSRRWGFAFESESDRQARPLRVTHESSIPMGAGAGSSAAMCVSMVRIWQSYFEKMELTWTEEHAAATELENRFHGKSSGMDTAAVMSSSPIVYKKGSVPRPLRAMPSLPFVIRCHDTGLRSSTRACVEKVMAWGKRHPETAQACDETMDRATHQAASAWERADGGALAKSLKLAQFCFEEWGLMTPSMTELKEKLEREGALAVKATGAGDGGFLISLWSAGT